MKVFLAASSPEPLEALARAARLCTSSADIQKIRGPIPAARAEKLVRRVLSSGHESILEHVSFTFIAEAVSRACSHQLVRHRIASYSQQSQRYVELKSEPDWIVPPEISADRKLLEIFERQLASCWETYKTLMNAGAAPEDARAVLPNATPTRVMFTMNARTLVNFFRLRLCHRAQREIRHLALKMLELVMPILPVVFDSAGPGCVSGKCPEGALCCGKPFSTPLSGEYRFS